MSSDGDSRGREREERAVTPAGLVRRAGVACIDGAILMSVVLWLGRGYREAGLWSGLPNETLWFYPVAGGFIVLAYQFVFLLGMQSTPGMAFFRLSLSDSAGDRPAAAQVAVRILVSLISAAAFGLGYLWAVFHRRKQTWHDLAADTIVIRGSPGRRPSAARALRRRSGPKTYRMG